MASSLIEEAVNQMSSEIKTTVGLSLVSDPGFLSLYAGDDSLIARVPATMDPMDDIDLIRSVWFASSRVMSNDTWD
ncbi:MAG: hypothetical protein Unbinned80contig1000_52 [Prokaryotic dsDNA virus sp.]|nr:MAG: hypothetical protein Unbinned80contig1000_52 [Prokaryotic dsDNA virus sp.]